MKNVYTALLIVVCICSASAMGCRNSARGVSSPSFQPANPPASFGQDYGQSYQQAPVGSSSRSAPAMQGSGSRQAPAYQGSGSR